MLHFDKHQDLALLDHTGIPSSEYYEMESAVVAPVVGDAMTAFGYPDWAPGQLVNNRPGFVSSLLTRSGVDMIEVTQQLTQGMSGGPLVNADGKVVGIIHKGGPTEGRQLAIRRSMFEAWLRTLGY